MATRRSDKDKDSPSAKNKENGDSEDNGDADGGLVHGDTWDVDEADGFGGDPFGVDSGGDLGR